MTYKFADDVGVSCGPVIVTELTPPKETDVKTDFLLQVYKFASSIEPYLSTRNNDMPDYLLDECCALIEQLNVMIISRTKED